MKIFHIHIICLFISLPIIGQSSISGVIYDNITQETLPGVNVYIPEFQQGTITDENGYFELSNLPNGNYKVQYSFIGYSTIIQTIELIETNLKIDIKLSQVKIQAQEVIVTGGRIGSQHENAIKIESFKKEQLNNASAENIIQKISSIPGVDAISKGNNIATPVIRGLSTSNIVVLNNGIRLENYQFSEDHPYTLDESDIGSIELIKGPASLLYGSDAVGGVLNFIKQTPAPVGTTKATLNASYNSNDNSITTSANIKHSKNNLFGGISGNNHSAKDFYTGNNNQVPNTRSNSNSIKLFSGYRNSHGVFRIYYDYNKLKAGITNKESISLITNNSRKNEIWFQNLDNHLLSSKNTLFFNKLKLNINLSYQHNNRQLLGSTHTPKFTLVDMKLKTYTWQAKASYDFSRKNNLIITTQGLWQENLNSTAPVQVLRNYTSLANSIAGLWQYTIGKSTFYQLGMRYDYKQITATEQLGPNSSNELQEAFFKTYNNISFSSGFTWELNSNLLFRANIASAHRTPSIAELLQDGPHGNRYEIGNRNFNSQRNIEGDISVHFHSENFVVDLSTFYNSIYQYIFLSPTSDTADNGMDIFRYNQNNATIYGVEISATYSIFKGTTLNASYSNLHAKQNNGEYLPFIPQDKINLTLLWAANYSKQKHKLLLGINPLLALSQNKPHKFETHTENYFLINAFIKTQLKFNKQKIIIGIYANNILNASYYDHLSTLKELGYYNMGRNFSFRLKIPIEL